MENEHTDTYTFTVDVHLKRQHDDDQLTQTTAREHLARALWYQASYSRMYTAVAFDATIQPAD